MWSDNLAPPLSQAENTKPKYIAAADIPNTASLEDLNRPLLSPDDVTKLATTLVASGDWTKPETINVYCKLMLYIALHLDFPTFQSCWDQYFINIPPQFRYKPLELSIAGYQGWPHAEFIPEAFKMYQYMENSHDGWERITTSLQLYKPMPVGTFMAFCQNHFGMGFRELNLPRQLHAMPLSEISATFGSVTALSSDQNGANSPVLWIFSLDNQLSRLAKIKDGLYQDHDPVYSPKPGNPLFKTLTDLVIALFKDYHDMIADNPSKTFADIQNRFRPLVKNTEARTWLELALENEHTFRFGCRYYRACLAAAQHAEQSNERAQILLALGYSLKANGLTLWTDIEKRINREPNAKTQQSLQIRLGILLAMLVQGPETDFANTLENFATIFRDLSTNQNMALPKLFRAGRRGNNAVMASTIITANIVADHCLALANWARALPDEAYALFHTRYNALVAHKDIHKMNPYIEISLGCHLIWKTMQFMLRAPGVEHGLTLMNGLKQLFAESDILPELTLIERAITRFVLPPNQARTTDDNRLLSNLTRLSTLLKFFWKSVFNMENGNYTIQASYLIHLFTHINAALKAKETPNTTTYPQPQDNNIIQTSYFEFMAFSHQYAHQFDLEELKVSFLLDYIELYKGFNPLAQHQKIHALLRSTKMRRTIENAAPTTPVTKNAAAYATSSSSTSEVSSSSSLSATTINHYPYPMTPQTPKTINNNAEPITPIRISSNGNNSRHDDDDNDDNDFLPAAMTPTATPPISKIRAASQPAAYKAMLHYSAIIVLASIPDRFDATPEATKTTLAIGNNVSPLAVLLQNFQQTLTHFDTTSHSTVPTAGLQKNRYQRFYSDLLTPLLVNADIHTNILLASCQITVQNALATLANVNEPEDQFIHILQLTQQLALEVFQYYEGKMNIDQAGSFLMVFCSIIDFNYQLAIPNSPAAEVWQQLCVKAVYDFETLESHFMDYFIRNNTFGLMKINQFMPDEMKLIRAYLLTLVNQSTLVPDADAAASLMRSAPSTPVSSARLAASMIPPQTM